MWGQMSTDDPTKGLGERCKHPSNPQAKHGFCAYLRSDRSHPEHFFSVFLSDGRAPPNIAGLGKLSPSQWVCGYPLQHDNCQIWTKWSENDKIDKMTLCATRDSSRR